MDDDQRQLKDMRTEAASIRAEALLIRLSSLDAFCAVAETYMQTDRLEEALLRITRVRNELPAIETLLQKLPVESVQTGRLVKKIKSRLENLEEEARQKNPSARPSGSPQYIDELCIKAGIDFYDLCHRFKMLPTELRELLNDDGHPAWAATQKLPQEVRSEVQNLQEMAATDCRKQRSRERASNGRV